MVGCKSNDRILNFKKVGLGKFEKVLEKSGLDSRGSFALGTASGNEHGIFYEGEIPIGYTISSNKYSNLSGLAIHQNYRGKGYGKKTVELLKENARKNGDKLFVCALPSTYEFFQKCGLSMTGHEPGEVWLIDE